LNKYFDDVPPEKGSDFDYCINYIQNQFKLRWTGDNLCFQTTCALDNERMQSLFDELQDLFTRNEEEFLSKEFFPTGRAQRTNAK